MREREAKVWSNQLFARAMRDGCRRCEQEQEEAKVDAEAGRAASARMDGEATAETRQGKRGANGARARLLT